MKKKCIIGIAVAALLIALVAPRFVRLPEDAAVTIYNAEKSVTLSAEDSAELIERLNGYGFWLRESKYFCDCASDFGITIGDAGLSYAGGHLHWDERGLTLNLEDEDVREIGWIAERYLYRNG